MRVSERGPLSAVEICSLTSSICRTASPKSRGRNLPPEMGLGRCARCEPVVLLLLCGSGRNLSRGRWQEMRNQNGGRLALTECCCFLFSLQEVGLVDYHSHHVRDYSSHLAQPHRRRPSLLSEFQPGNERSVFLCSSCGLERSEAPAFETSLLCSSLVNPPACVILM